MTFPLYHFSCYYPARFKNEFEAAKYYGGQLAARKVLGDAGGDVKLASRVVAKLLADKVGLGDSEFAKGTLADIAADQDVIKVVDEI